MERVALYNPEIRDKNPMTAFRIKNTTGLTLEGGPVTVFEGSAYVGEAMLDTMRKDEERLTPYSVELGIVVKREQSQVRERYNRAYKSGAYLYKMYEQLLVTTYEFSSRLERPVTAYIDHRFQHQVRRDTAEPVETTEHFWRFKTALEPKRTTIFKVTEVCEQYECIEVAGIARAAIHQLVSEELISDAVRAALESVADQAEKIRKIEEEIAKAEEQEQKIEDGQERLRANLQALGSTSEESKLRQRYVSSLAKEEEKIEQLRLRSASLRDDLEREREVLNQMVEALELR